MKIAVNARWLLPGKLEGTGVYTLRMLEQIIPAFPQHEFHLLLDRQVDTGRLGLDFPNLSYHVVSPPARHPWLWAMWNDWAVPQKLKRLNADLYWSPDGLPAKTNIRQWMTIHDLNFEHHPQWVPAPVAKYYSKNIKRGAEVADKVFTVSHWSKDDLRTTYGLPEDKISVTYNAPQRKFSPGTSSNEGAYFCAVGALTPRKNLKTLLLAFDKWCFESSEDSINLRVAGEPHFSDPELKSVVSGLKHPDRVEWMGRLNDGELEELYRGAIAYCMPSAMEGFGIPLVEAMQCGTPVIASDNSAITEVVADKGLLVPTYDIDAWAAALERMQQERSHWSALALERGKDFDWATSAQPWIDALKG